MKDSRKIPVVGDGTWAAIIPLRLLPVVLPCGALPTM